jgi:D-3-phosphoglycerate dehydrogenase
MKSKFHVVVAEPFDEASLACLQDIATIEVLADSAPATLVKAIVTADALIVKSKAHVTARIIDAAPNLKVIGRASPNYDHIDLRAAGRRNIRVVYSPHVAVSSIAEFTFGMILTLARRIVFFDRCVREGKFDSVRTASGRELSRLTIGILGIDPTSERLGKMISGSLGSPIICHDPENQTPRHFQARVVSLDGLLAESDVISVHLPLTPLTRGILSVEKLAMLKPTAMLVNTSRGALIDTVSLAGSLRRHQIAGAALDVYEVEPLPMDHPIRGAPNCILTPHVAGATLDASTERFAVTEDVARVLSGLNPTYAVTLPKAAK